MFEVLRSVAPIIINCSNSSGSDCPISLSVGKPRIASVAGSGDAGSTQALSPQDSASNPWPVGFAEESGVAVECLCPGRSAAL